MITHREDDFPLEDQEGGGVYGGNGRKVKGPSMGQDAMGRLYSTLAMRDMNEGQPSTSPIPTAGAGATWEGDTRRLENKPTRFMPSGEGDAGHIVIDRGNPSGGPVHAYVDDESPSAVTRVGPNFLLGTTSGIAEASPANWPDSRTSALKARVSKGLGKGLFRSVLDGGVTLGPVDEEVTKMLGDALSRREDVRKRALAKAQDVLRKAAYDEDEEEQEDDDDSKSKAAYDEDEDDKKSKDEDEETSTSKSGIWAAHVARKAKREEALLSKRQSGGRLDGNRI